MDSIRNSKFPSVWHPKNSRPGGHVSAYHKSLVPAQELACAYRRHEDHHHIPPHMPHRSVHSASKIGALSHWFHTNWELCVSYFLPIQASQVLHHFILVAITRPWAKFCIISICYYWYLWLNFQMGDYQSYDDYTIVLPRNRQGLNHVVPFNRQGLDHVVPFNRQGLDHVVPFNRQGLDHVVPFNRQGGGRFTEIYDYDRGPPVPTTNGGYGDSRPPPPGHPVGWFNDTTIREAPWNDKWLVFVCKQPTEPTLFSSLLNSDLYENEFQRDCVRRTE